MNGIEQAFPLLPLRCLCGFDTSRVPVLWPQYQVESLVSRKKTTVEKLEPKRSSSGIWRQQWVTTD